MRWLDYLPIVPLTIAAILLGLSPPFAEPHLWQKFKLLAANELRQSIDISDFFLHLSLIVVLALKLVRVKELRRMKPR
jgi:hypothetical protein